MAEVLIVDDENKIREILHDFLEEAGFSVFEACDGKEAMSLITKKSFDLIIMDVMMPNMNGIDTCMKIRRISQIPIILLTAKNQENDYIQGFKAGADDYIAKPFSNKILVEKVKAMLRRNGKKEKKYDLGELKLDTGAMRAYFNGEDLNLTATEYDIVILFIDNENIALSRDRIIHKVWGYNYSGDPRTLDTHIKNLRKKLNDKYIETIRGYGYRFEVIR